MPWPPNESNVSAPLSRYLQIHDYIEAIEWLVAFNDFERVLLSFIYKLTIRPKEIAWPSNDPSACVLIGALSQATNCSVARERVVVLTDLQASNAHDWFCSSRRSSYMQQENGMLSSLTSKWRSRTIYHAAPGRRVTRNQGTGCYLRWLKMTQSYHWECISGPPSSTETTEHMVICADLRSWKNPLLQVHILLSFMHVWSSLSATKTKIDMLNV